MRRCCTELMAGPAGAELRNTGTRQRVGGGARSLSELGIKWAQGCSIRDTQTYRSTSRFYGTFRISWKSRTYCWHRRALGYSSGSRHWILSKIDCWIVQRRKARNKITARKRQREMGEDVR